MWDLLYRVVLSIQRTHRFDPSFVVAQVIAAPSCVCIAGLTNMTNSMQWRHALISYEVLVVLCSCTAQRTSHTYANTHTCCPHLPGLNNMWCAILVLCFCMPGGSVPYATLPYGSSYLLFIFALRICSSYLLFVFALHSFSPYYLLFIHICSSYLLARSPWQLICHPLCPLP